MKKSYLLLIIGVALMVITSCKKKEPVVPPVPPTPHGGDVMTMPYTQSFATEFGTYTTKNVLGDQVWTIDYSSAVMSGHVNDNGNHIYYENEDWLISSPVQITGVQHAKAVVNYAAQYQGPSDNDVVMMVSSDYTFGNEPASATWTQLSETFPNTEGWTFTDKELNLDPYIGKNLTVAIKFYSSTTKSRTMEIKSIKVEEGEASGGGGGGGQGGEVQDMPYIQSFESDFGTYTTKDVLGAESWMIDYSTAKMTGYVGGTNNADEDWLISSPVNVTGVDNAKIVMEYICRYFSSVNDDITLWASEDYVFDDMPNNTAHWSQLSSSLSESSSWSDWKTAEISLDEYIGKTITIAVKYLSNTTKAGTIEIKSITVEEGGVAPTPPGPTPPGPGTGSGTADDPYNVASGISLQGQDVIAWVQGYIVGAVRNGSSTVSSNDDVIWAAPFDSYTNVVIADDASCHEISNCVIVNLPSGKPLRAQVNLYDNPGNWGKQLAVLGKLRTYFGQAGLRDSNGTEADFVLEGGVTPPPTPGTDIFAETFTSGQGQFTIQDVSLPEGLTYVWAHSSQYKCMKASAYVQQAYATESWLVSPSISLSDVDSAKLSFEHCCKYETNPQQEMTVWVTSNYTGDVTTTAWTQLMLSAYGSNFSWINSGDIDLSSYVGGDVVVAFKYVSTTSSAPSWEVKNFKIAE